MSMVNNPYFPCYHILTTSISLLDNTSFRTGRIFLSVTSCEADGLHPFLNFRLVLSTKKILSLRVFWLEAERVVLWFHFTCRDFARIQREAFRRNLQNSWKFTITFLCWALLGIFALLQACFPVWIVTIWSDLTNVRPTTQLLGHCHIGNEWSAIILEITKQRENEAK